MGPDPNIPNEPVTPTCRDQPSTPSLCLEHLGGPVPRRAAAVDAPRGVRVFERQYRERRTSRRLRANGGFRNGG